MITLSDKALQDVVDAGLQALSGDDSAQAEESRAILLRGRLVAERAAGNDMTDAINEREKDNKALRQRLALEEAVEAAHADAEEHARADAKAIKEMLVAAGFHVGKILLNGPSRAKRSLCVYLDRGAPDPVASVLKLVIDESLDVVDKESVIDAIHHITDLLGSPEYTAKTNASAMVVFWRNIPWTE